MQLDLAPLGIDTRLAHTIRQRIDRLVAVDRPRFERLWRYYRNPMSPAAQPGTSHRPYRQAQEWGLPRRITGTHAAADPLAGVDAAQRKEVVIENDIGWRIEAGVDYLFGKPLVIESSAPDPARRRTIGRLLRLIVARNGGLTFLQQLALIGGVCGFVDVLVKLEPDTDSHGRQDVLGQSDADLRALGEKPAASRDLAGDGPDPLPPDPLPREPAHAAPANPLAQHDDAQHSSAQQSTVRHARAPRLAIRNTSSAGGTGDDREPAHADALPDPLATALDTGSGADHADDHPPASPRASTSDTGAATQPLDEALLMRLARLVRLEIVEPSRALPVLDPADYRVVRLYGQLFDQPAHGDDDPQLEQFSRGRWWQRWLAAATHAASDATRRLAATDTGPAGVTQVVELISPAAWQRYENGRLRASGPNRLGRIPLVHLQNLPLPFEYAGGSDVEPLIPLQDELNTRLSDRAYRITMQSFKMYLGRGVDGFEKLPVGPGRMWATDRTDADVLEFGGDSHCPSEEAAIADVREALDKSSGVTPIAAGAIKGRVGQLTSAAALRVTLGALIARTEKKRSTYGGALSRMCELALEWLDAAGLFPTAPHERGVELSWSSVLPSNDLEKLQEAELKSRLGIDRALILRELGY